MTQNLLTITIPKDANKSLKEQTINLPMFSVITGLNGSGKTHLLEFIDKNETNKFVRYIDAKYNHGLEEVFKMPVTTVEDNMYKYNEEGSIIHANGSTVINANTLPEIKNKKVNGYDTTMRGISNTLKAFDKYVIKKLFDNMKGKADYDKLETIEIRHINKRLEDFELNNLKFDHTVVDGILSFKKDNQVIQASKLSTGEQLCVAIALWELSVDKDDEIVKTDLLLIDEPDAHLNPSLMRNLYNVLKKVSENGTRVVITTHNPVFINLVDHESLFWMENGWIFPRLQPKTTDDNNGILPHDQKIPARSKRKILNILAGGLIGVSRFGNICEYLFSDNAVDNAKKPNGVEKPKNVILCEGGEDQEFLFSLVKNFDKTFNIINCLGAMNIQYFLKLPFHENNQDAKILCIFDNDQEGKEGKGPCDDIISKMNEEKQDKFKTIFISQTDGDRLEEMMDDDVKKEELLSSIKEFFNFS
jgi:ABC-type lipoprotein export system ATPase subunit